MSFYTRVMVMVALFIQGSHAETAHHKLERVAKNLEDKNGHALDSVNNLQHRELMHASGTGDVEQVRQLLAQGTWPASVNHWDDFTDTGVSCFY